MRSLRPFVDPLVLGNERANEDCAFTVLERHADGRIFKPLLDNRHIADTHSRAIRPLEERHAAYAGYVVELAADFQTDIATIGTKAPGRGLAIRRCDERCGLANRQAGG